MRPPPAAAAGPRRGAGPVGEIMPDTPPAGDRAVPVLDRAALLVIGAVLLHAAYVDWGRGDVFAHPDAMALVLVGYAGAFALLALGASRSRATVAVPALVLAGGLFALLSGTYLFARATPFYGTDTAAFIHYSAQLAIDGQNPYAHSMRAAIEAYNVPRLFNTPTTAGGIIDRISWPAGSFLVFVPFLRLGVTDIRWVVLAFHVATLLVLFGAAPRVARSAILLPLFVLQDFADFTAGGVVDAPWVLPLVASALVLDRRPALAGVLFGAACAVKQVPWFLAPFLAVYLWRPGSIDSSLARLRREARFLGTAAAVFALVNAPYALGDPGAWVAGVFAPVAGEAIPFGSGLSMLSQVGLPLRNTFYDLAAIAVTAALLVNYAASFRVLQHTLWIYPAIITWFSSRSLQNYSVYLLPAVAAAVIVLLRDRGAAAPEPVARDPALPAPRVNLRVAGVSALLCAIALAGGAWLSYGRDPASGAAVVVRDVPESAARLGGVAELTVRVTNRSDATLEPRFSVVWRAFPVYWHAMAGPGRLAPGASGAYRIGAGTADRAIPLATPFVVRVNHARGTVFAQSPPDAVEPARRPPLWNPDLTFWDAGTAPGLRTPYGWSVLRLGNRAGNRVAIGPGAADGRPAAVATIHQAGARDGPRLAGVALSQPVDDPRAVGALLGRPLGLWVRPAYDSRIEGTTPLVIYGVEIGDGARRLWIAFSGTEAGWHRLSGDHVVVVIPAPRGTWSRRTIILRDLYRRLRWRPPSRVTFALIAGASRRAPGDYTAIWGPIEAGMVPAGPP